MLRYIYDNFLDEKQKYRVKQYYRRIDRVITGLFFSYDYKELRHALQKLGLRRGDTVLMHSAFHYSNGFKGTPQDVINCLIEVLGEDGNLLMVSMPYRSSSYEYLSKKPIFDIRKTPSEMGIISEIFRRKSGVFRSQHPTHPILAFGKDAARITEGHHVCVYPLGKDSPFDKFRILKGKILFFNVPFDTFTFIHYIEDLTKEKVPLSIYSDDLMSAKMIDYSGNCLHVNTYVFSNEAVTLRNPKKLETNLIKYKMLKRHKTGRTHLMLVSAEDAITCTYKMLEKNIYFYDLVK
jgi:aminoglycoside 3-N-acetyltransferase